jgi:hypothetical protein
MAAPKRHYSKEEFARGRPATIVGQLDGLRHWEARR